MYSWVSIQQSNVKLIHFKQIYGLFYIVFGGGNKIQQKKNPFYTMIEFLNQRTARIIAHSDHCMYYQCNNFSKNIKFVIVLVLDSIADLDDLLIKIFLTWEKCTQI